MHTQGTVCIESFRYPRWVELHVTELTHSLLLKCRLRLIKVSTSSRLTDFTYTPSHEIQDTCSLGILSHSRSSRLGIRPGVLGLPWRSTSARSLWDSVQSSLVCPSSRSLAKGTGWVLLILCGASVTFAASTHSEHYPLTCPPGLHRGRESGPSGRRLEFADMV